MELESETNAKQPHRVDITLVLNDEEREAVETFFGQDGLRFAADRKY